MKLNEFPMCVNCSEQYMLETGKNLNTIYSTIQNLDFFKVAINVFNSLEEKR